MTAPWTEGRKNFVRDLSLGMADHHDVTTVTTGNGDTSALGGSTILVPTLGMTSAVPSLVAALRRELRNSQPDAILHFPHGTFAGLRRLGNEWSISAIRRYANKYGVPSLAILYSIDGRPTPKHTTDRNDVLATDLVPVERRIPVGVYTERWAPLERSSDGRTLLFMAGMLDSRQIGDVLGKRGLGTFLAAGEQLARNGFKGIGAVPMFRDPGLAERVLRDTINTWPAGTLRLRGAVDVPEIFATVDAYVFCYKEEIGAFCPTSVVEAMLSNTPVVLADHTWLRKHVAEMAACWFDPGDPASLTEAAIRAINNRNELSQIGRDWADSMFDIKRSIETIFDRLSRL